MASSQVDAQELAPAGSWSFQTIPWGFHFTQAFEPFDRTTPRRPTSLMLERISGIENRGLTLFFFPFSSISSKSGCSALNSAPLKPLRASFVPIILDGMAHRDASLTARRIFKPFCAASSNVGHSLLRQRARRGGFRSVEFLQGHTFVKYWDFPRPTDLAKMLREFVTLGDHDDRDKPRSPAFARNPLAICSALQQLEEFAQCFPRAPMVRQIAQAYFSVPSE